MLLPLISHQLQIKSNLLFNKSHFSMTLTWMKIILVLWAADLSVTLYTSLSWIPWCPFNISVTLALFAFSSWPHVCTAYLKNKVSWFNLFEDLSSRLNCKLSSWYRVTKIRSFKATWSFSSRCIISGKSHCRNTLQNLFLFSSEAF